MKSYLFASAIFLAFLLTCQMSNAALPWNSATPINFHTLYPLSPDEPNNIDWYVTDKSTGIEYKIPENEETEYYFNLDGRDEWGEVTIRPVYVCPNSGKETAFNPSTFTIDVLDYGIYFLGEGNDGEVLSEKFLPGVRSLEDLTFYDSEKMNVLYVHGWQPHPGGSAADHHSREASILEIKEWRDRGYNVAAFYWNQFGDNIDLLGTEEKIYSAQALSWTHESDDYSVKTDEASPNTSVAEILSSNIESLGLEAGCNKLIVAGHSLGGQLSSRALNLLPSSSLPDQLVLLDIWFSNSRINASETNSNLFVENNLKYLADNGVAITWYETTPLAKFANPLGYDHVILPTAYVVLDLRYTDYTDLKPLEVYNPGARHTAVVSHYFSSITDSAQSLPRIVMVDEEGTLSGIDGNSFIDSGWKGPNAHATNSLIKGLKGTKLYQVNGNDTESSSDDLLKVDTATFSQLADELPPTETQQLGGDINLIILDAAGTPLSDQSSFEIYSISDKGVETPLIVRSSDAGILGENKWKTNSAGGISILKDEISACAVQLKVRKKVGEEQNFSGSTNQYEIWVDNGEFDDNPNNTVKVNYAPVASGNITLVHTELAWSIQVSIEWDADDNYIEGLKTSFIHANRFMYDYSDGQMYLREVKILRNKESWSTADIRFHASNQQWPTAKINGWDYAQLQIDMPRQAFGEGTLSPETQAINSVESPYPYIPSYNQYRTIGHELAHYFLGVYDEYLTPQGGYYPRNEVNIFGLMGDDKSIDVLLPNQLMPNDFSRITKPRPGGLPGSEMSSSLSYEVFGASYPTLQLHKKGKSVWESFEEEWEGTFELNGDVVFAQIVKPEEHGNLSNGLYFLGPHNFIDNRLKFIDPETSYKGGAEAVVKFGIAGIPSEKLAGSIEIYSTTNRNGKIEYINQGTAGFKGTARLLGVLPGDTISATIREPARQGLNDENRMIYFYGQDVYSATMQEIVLKDVRTGLLINNDNAEPAGGIIIDPEVVSVNPDIVETEIITTVENSTDEIYEVTVIPDTGGAYSTSGSLISPNHNLFNVSIPFDQNSSNSGVILYRNREGIPVIKSEFTFARLESANPQLYSNADGGVQLAVENPVAIGEALLVSDYTSTPAHFSFATDVFAIDKTWQIDVYPNTNTFSETITAYFKYFDQSTESELEESEYSVVRWDENLEQWVSDVAIIARDTEANVIVINLQRPGIYTVVGRKPCNPQNVLQGIFTGGSFTYDFSAETSLYSEPQVPFELQDSVSAALWAGSDLMFSPGFVAEKGTDVKAFIGNCSGISTLSPNGRKAMTIEEGISNTGSALYKNENSLSVWPNPFVDRLNINLPETTGSYIQVQILTLNGIRVGSHRFEGLSGNDKIVIPFNSLEEGLYLLEILDSNGIKSVIKILKKN